MRLPFFRRRADDDFRDEIASHLAHEADRQRAQADRSADDARHAARRAFGNVALAGERFHDANVWLWAERWTQHLRVAMRAIRLRPGFSIAATLTLGLGIGFNTAVFTIVYALGFRAFPVRDAGRLVNVYQLFSGKYSRNVHGSQTMVSYPEFQSYEQTIDSARAHGGAIASAAVYADDDFAWTAARAGAIHGQFVSCGFFATTGVALHLGHAFAPSDCAGPGASAVAVVSYATWMRDMGGDSTAIGRTVRVNQTPFTVIGVAEKGFSGLTIQPSGVWLPATMQMAVSRGQSTDSILVRDWSWMVMVARLAPDATPSAAKAELAVPAARRDRLYPGRTTQVVATRGAMLNFPEARTRGALAAVLLGVLGALVVVMICANLMNLLLARGLARRREIGIRLAIGASRGRLIEQLVVESGVLALIGGALGLALAIVLPPMIPRLLPIELQMDLSPDIRILAFSAAISIVTAFLFGLVPALQSTRVDLVSASKGGWSGGLGRVRPARLRAFIVGVQVAGSALLLIVAALFVRAAGHGATIDPGYATEGVATFEMNLSRLGYEGARAKSVYDALVARIAATPGVQAVAVASPLPLLGRRSDMIRPENGTDDQVVNASMASVSGEYLTTMRIPIVAGRAFTDADLQAAGNGTQPAVLSQSLARRLSPNGSPVGMRLVMNGVHYIATGVAADARSIAIDDATTPFVYLPGRPGQDRDLRIVVRAAGPLAPLERLVPQWANAIDPSIVVTPQRMSDRVALELMPARISSAVAGTMGGLTLLLALIGIYGVVSYSVSQHRREIAVRLALGASERGVVRLMMRSGSRAVLIGLAVGSLAALGVSQVLRGVLLGVSPLDAAAYVFAVVTLLGASMAAIYVPARRAAGVDPASTLRED